MKIEGNLKYILTTSNGFWNKFFIDQKTINEMKKIPNLFEK